MFSTPNILHLKLNALPLAREREPLGTDVQSTDRSVIRGPKYWSHILYVFMVLCKANNAFHS